MRVGLLHTRIRLEEKLLIEQAQARGVDLELIDVRNLILELDQPGPFQSLNVVLDRCISQSQSETVTILLDQWGIPCVNRFETNRICGNKIETSARLLARGVPTVPVRVALTAETAMTAIEAMGYPVVIKPATGSWGRLLAKVNDRDAAEAILEHKSTLGSYQHSIFYIQPFVEKGASDIRTFVIDGETLCGIERNAEHWITNTARGARATRCEITEDVDSISRRAAAAVGGGMLAVDLFRTDDGLVVNEINSSMEFRNSSEPTGVNIPQRMIDYVIKVGEGADPVPPGPRSNASLAE